MQGQRKVQRDDRSLPKGLFQRKTETMAIVINVSYLRRQDFQGGQKPGRVGSAGRPHGLKVWGHMSHAVCKRVWVAA